MQENTKVKFLSFCVALAAGYGVTNVKDQFAVNPTVAQKLVDKIVEQDTFLQKINSVPVTEISGQKVFGSVEGVVPSRTNTDTTDRTPQNVLALGSKDYSLSTTEFDFAIKYNKIDAWAKFPDFRDRYNNWLRKAVAMARIRVGWYGIQTAAATNKTNFPMGQDVNKGWFQIMREYAAGSNWLTTGTAQAGQIRIGAGGDFVNLDAAVHACLQFIDPIYRESKDLVVFIGSDLLAIDKGALYDAQGDTPSEKERIANEKVTRTYGGLPVDTPSGFPARGLFITSYDNLSWYYQDSSVRRQIIDNPKRNQIEEYASANEGYVVEDEEKAAGFEFANIKVKTASGWV